MRFLRFAALIGSLVLLVATAVSVLNHVGELRDNQERRVAQSVALASSSVDASIQRVRDDVHLAALAANRAGGGDDPDLAADIAALTPGADVCIGETSAGCTGLDLFSTAVVGELAVESARGSADDVTSVLIATDADQESIIAVRRIEGDGFTTTVAAQVPVDTLIADTVSNEIDQLNSDIDVTVMSRTADTPAGSSTVIDGQRILEQAVSAPFAEGSVVIAASVDSGIGIAGNRTTATAIQLLLGTTLLVLAWWTFQVERKQLEKRATTDELTGLINRREFERVCEGELDTADRFNTGLCLMVVDLNGFKAVNDTLGHQFGDLVLKASSERLVAAVRDSDVVGRWGGDEFVILLPGLSERGAVRKSAERVWNSLAGSPVVGDTVMTASIGAAVFPRHGTTLDMLMRAADVAMYDAKTTGVSHRIADTIAVAETLLADDDPAAQPIVTEEYIGPDRRHLDTESPVPPPPTPPAELGRSGQHTSVS